MKSRLMLASMILLASLSATAQKIYTGTIEYKKNGIVVVPDQKSDKKNSTIFIRNIATQLYGEKALTDKLDDEKGEIYKTISVQSLKNSDIDWRLKKVPGSILKANQIYVTQITGFDGASSSSYSGGYLINLKEGTAYDIYNKTTKKIKI